ncbi:MAG TPA: hypothetical protein VM889_12570 [Candidatus Thermoplasmatota archaeon]|nr:hypothetical protein [Candidatus Thermoplasmatota archaeon]
MADEPVQGEDRGLARRMHRDFPFVAPEAARELAIRLRKSSVPRPDEDRRLALVQLLGDPYRARLMSFLLGKAELPGLQKLEVATTTVWAADIASLSAGVFGRIPNEADLHKSLVQVLTSSQMKHVVSKAIVRARVRIDGVGDPENEKDERKKQLLKDKLRQIKETADERANERVPKFAAKPEYVNAVLRRVPREIEGACYKQLWELKRAGLVDERSSRSGDSLWYVRPEAVAELEAFYTALANLSGTVQPALSTRRNWRKEP